MKKIKNNWTYILGGIIGVVAGYLYWRYIGCSTGTCSITSSPTMSTIYGSMMGILIGGLFKRKGQAKE